MPRILASTYTCRNVPSSFPNPLPHAIDSKNLLLRPVRGGLCAQKRDTLLFTRNLERVAHRVGSFPVVLPAGVSFIHSPSRQTGSSRPDDYARVTHVNCPLKSFILNCNLSRLAARLIMAFWLFWIVCATTWGLKLS